MKNKKMRQKDKHFVEKGSGSCDYITPQPYMHAFQRNCSLKVVQVFFIQSNNVGTRFSVFRTLLVYE